jgi:hypothetical protein
MSLICSRVWTWILEAALTFMENTEVEINLEIKHCKLIVLRIKLKAICKSKCLLKLYSAHKYNKICYFQRNVKIIFVITNTYL